MCYRIYFTLIINKYFNFCCFRALAYTTLDRLCAVFLYNCVKINISAVAGSRRLHSIAGDCHRVTPECISQATAAVMLRQLASMQIAEMTADNRIYTSACNSQRCTE